MTMSSVPIYGVEPYNPLDVPVTDLTGGGADVTQENLLITLWTLPDAADLSSPGTLIKPLPWTTDAALATGSGVRKQAFRSRLSTKFQFDQSNGDDSPNMLAILNPPQELKESFLLNDAPSLAAAGLNSGLSIFGPWAWEAFCVDPDGEAAIAQFAFSSFSNATGTTRFARTNGADGVWPEFYPGSNLAEVTALLNALRAGEPFYIVSLIEPEIDEGYVTIRWPFSGGARG